MPFQRALAWQRAEGGDGAIGEVYGRHESLRHRRNR
jgi:hypothetical protein